MTTRHIDSIWADESNVARFRVLWESGETTRVIGGKLGVSHSAICGKRRRLGLPQRPSPIKHTMTEGSVRMREYRRRKAKELPSLPSLPSEVAVADAPKPVIVVAPKSITVTPKPVTVSAFVGRVRECCWPTGKKGREHLFCNAPTIPGKVYCLEHCHISYVRVRDRREDSHV